MDVNKNSNDFALTSEMLAARNEILDSDTRLIWVYGKAETGKSTFLEYMRKVEKMEDTICLAPTGIAALIISGATIHSFFPDTSRKFLCL